MTAKRAKILKVGVDSVPPSLLTKIRDAGKELLSAPAHNKLGLTIGLTSLGLGISNYRANRVHQAQATHVAKVEDKSLKALEKIHEALTSSTKKVSK